MAAQDQLVASDSCASYLLAADIGNKNFPVCDDGDNSHFVMLATISNL